MVEQHFSVKLDIVLALHALHWTTLLCFICNGVTSFMMKYCYFITVPEYPHFQNIFQQLLLFYGKNLNVVSTNMRIKNKYKKIGMLFQKRISPHYAHCSNLSCVRPVFMTFHSLSLNETSSARQISRVAKVKACCWRTGCTKCDTACSSKIVKVIK